MVVSDCIIKFIVGIIVFIIMVYGIYHYLKIDHEHSRSSKIACRICGYKFWVRNDKELKRPIGPQYCPNCGHTA